MSRMNAFRCSAFAACGLIALAGCSNTETYETRKPAIENDDAPMGSVEENAEDAGDAAGETMEDAADAVTPDREISDVDTPIGDANVSEDPATGRKKVDVDAGADADNE